MLTSCLNHRLLCTLTLLFALATFATCPAQAQDDQEDRPAALEAGAWALQFSVKENFTLGSFRGSTISGRRHVSANRAWEAGLSLGASVRTQDQGGNSDTRDDQHFRLRTRYLAYPLLGEREEESIQLVVGAGPELSFGRDNGQRTVTRWSVGVGGTVGAEWFAYRHFSLFGYYESTFRYRRFEQDNPDPEVVDVKGSDFLFGNSGVRFGLSVYF